MRDSDEITFHGGLLDGRKIKADNTQPAYCFHHPTRNKVLIYLKLLNCDAGIYFYEQRYSDMASDKQQGMWIQEMLREVADVSFCFLPRSWRKPLSKPVEA